MSSVHSRQFCPSWPLFSYLVKFRKNSLFSYFISGTRSELYVIPSIRSNLHFCFWLWMHKYALYYQLLLSRFSHVWLCATLEMAAHQAPPSMGFSRQEYWSGVPLSSPKEPFNFSFFSITGCGIDLDYCDIEWFALETNRDHSDIWDCIQVLRFRLLLTMMAFYFF